MFANVNGVTTVGGYLIVATSNQIMRVNSTSTTQPDVELLAGSEVVGCQDGVGAAATLSSPKVIGTDGMYAYVRDGCGLRRVDPYFGRVERIDAAADSVSIHGRYMYQKVGSTLLRRDLATGTVTTVTTAAPSGIVVGNATTAWTITHSSVYRIDVATNTTVELVSNLSLGAVPSTALLVDDQIYLTVSSNPYYPYSTLARVDGTTGLKTAVVKGITGFGQDLSNINGIASSGQSLFVADNSGVNSSIINIQPADPAPYVSPTGPDMSAADIVSWAMPAHVTQANGIAVVKDWAVVANHEQIIRVNRRTQHTAPVVQILAGSTMGCTDAASGADARFSAARVVGSDGSYAYVRDGCGLRRVDPDTGATVTLGAAPDQVSVNGQDMYELTGSTLKRRNLARGTVQTLTNNAPYGAVVGDSVYAYIITHDSVYRINVDTRLTRTTPLQRPFTLRPTTAVLVDDSIFVAVAPGPYQTTSKLAVINTPTGTTTSLPGTTPPATPTAPTATPPSATSPAWPTTPASSASPTPTTSTAASAWA